MTDANPLPHLSRVEIPHDHPCFPGHFPGQPILPGVLLLERVISLAQTALAQSVEQCTLYNVKFLTSVVPGDQLEVRLVGTGPDEYKFTVRVLRADDEDGALACSGQLRTVRA